MIETEENIPSLRDTLSAAFEESTEEAPVVADVVAAPEATEEPPAVDETPSEAAQRARDEAGRFAKKPAEKLAAPVVAPEPAKAAPKVVAPPPAAPVVEMKPPQSWRGPAKETWAALPEAARVEVLRREKEIATQLAAVGEDRKFASTLRQTLAPYEAQIRAEGSTPEKAVGNLLNTAMALRTAPPAHKAQIVASIINDFGVPLEGLVAALQGRTPPQSAPQPQQLDAATIAQQVEKQLMERLTAQRESQLVAKYSNETESFLEKQPMHGLDGTDYSQDIREDMADIIERATKRGSPMTLERAYTLAARQHPEVAKVLERQERAAAAAKASASTQRARVAASSVRSSPATTPVTKGGEMDLRSALEAAFEANSGR